VGEEAFTLRQDFVKPFAQKDSNTGRKIFNYRLSRARRVENVFRIMASRFRIFHTEIHLKLDCIEVKVMACCILHNYLRRRCTSFGQEESNMGNSKETKMFSSRYKKDLADIRVNKEE
jgi:hypothetical protein